MIFSPPISTDTRPIIQWATSSYLWKYRRNKCFKNLEPDHMRFYKALLQTGGSYKWPKKPLYEWSRRVEYPFVIENLRNLPFAKILDAGSGVTFLPFHLINTYGFDVECLDSNRSYGSIMYQTINSLDSKVEIPYYIGDLSERLNFPNNSYDVVLSISVIEHIKPEKRLFAFSELWRLVRKGGRLIVTLDIALDNSSEGIQISELGDLLHNLAIEPESWPKLDNFPRSTITPQIPRYSILPVTTKSKGVIYFGLRSLYYDIIKKPVSNIGKLACLLLCIPKPL